MTLDGRGGIDAGLVQRLVADQFPQWADLPVRPVEVDGWDNRTYRLGEELTVRLPSHERYVAAVAKEQRWLPVLAPQLPLPVPAPIATGRPGQGYPHPWSVNRWLPGETASHSSVTDEVAFARDLAGFLTGLRAIDATDGPAAGLHSFFRGAPLSAYDEDTRSYLGSLPDRSLAARAQPVWDSALASRWQRPAVWFHGDIAVGNLLVEDGRLAAVIDFGTCGVGDPACDLVIAWTFLEGAAREAYRSTTALDGDTWARARGWALWKALIAIARDDARSEKPEWGIVDAVVAEHEGLPD